jgi:hypothetical protein
MENETPPARSKSNVRPYLAGGLLLLLLLSAAAFLAGRLMNAGGRAADLFGPGAPMGGRAMGIEFRLNPAPELPALQPEIHGLFASRDGNSLFLQTLKDGGSGVIVSNASGGGDQGFAYSAAGAGETGPLVEVVVTHETLIYRDATGLPDFEDSTVVEIQQVVEPGSLEDLSDQTMVSVWGRRTGNRILAEVIFYSEPMLIRKQGN